MNSIDWNKASELGLIERINKEILHPLGLAMCRNPEEGNSACLLIADDGVFTYCDTIELKPVLTKEEIAEKISGSQQTDILASDLEQITRNILPVSKTRSSKKEGPGNGCQ